MLERRLYTLTQARKALPYVKRIVADIVDVTAALERVKDEDEAARLEGRARKYFQELDAVGIELKDPKAGLVDFYWQRGDETVYLCWKHGEDDITHWHDLESGFSGRRAIEANDLALDEPRG